MGESIVQAPNVENKKNESLASGARLEVSVSFGRFENDSLSWEKWSSFSPNKYLEEAGKFSTPGSVAQKKAYFEAHYKKIAAQKAEQMEQEKQMETNCTMKDDQIGEDRVGNTSFTYTKLDVANGHRSAAYEQFTDSTGVVSSSLSDESNENASFTIECQSSSVNEAKDEIDSILDCLELNKSEAAVLIQEEACLYEFQGKGEFSPPILVQEETPINRSPEKLESPMNSEQETGNTLEIKMENVKLDASSQFQKMTLSKKEGSLEGTKKKPTTPLLKKSREISTPKTSKSVSKFTMMSDSSSSTKKANCSSLPKSKILSAGESKKVSPSLHMSLNLGPANSDSTSLTPIRKSLIMEKMGDKDIVKRAFKTFQNNFNQVRASGYENSSGQKEVVPTTRPEQKLSTSLTPRKENEGSRKAAEKMDAKRAQLGRSWNTTSVG
ncbi:hypothetical protein U1Q18_016978 [Sarracenia purpurea var. burkii]